MRKFQHEIYPFQMSILRFCRRCKQFVDAGKGQVELRDQVIVHHGLILECKLVLPVQHFQRFAQILLRLVLLQIEPVGQRIQRQFDSILFVCLGSSQSVSAEVTDEHRVDYGNEYTLRNRI